MKKINKKETTKLTPIGVKIINFFFISSNCYLFKLFTLDWVQFLSVEVINDIIYKNKSRSSWIYYIFQIQPELTNTHILIEIFTLSNFSIQKVKNSNIYVLKLKLIFPGEFFCCWQEIIIFCTETTRDHNKMQISLEKKIKE